MDFTRQAMPHIGYKVNEAPVDTLGYRALGMDFDDSGGRNAWTPTW
jgi:hypothetical protein